MRFTTQQYEAAMEHLRNGMGQLAPDANPCSICGDSGHMAWECGFNPLVAMHLCSQIAHRADDLHEILHYLAGYDSSFGVMLGPRKVVFPERGVEDLALSLAGRQEDDPVYNPD